MRSRVARVLALTLALLPLGCARPIEPARVAAVPVATPAPVTTPPPAPTWPDAAPAPDLPTLRCQPARPSPHARSCPTCTSPRARSTSDRRDLPALDAAAAWLRANPSQLVIVEGYTDALGPRAANLALAQRRARWVMEYLVAKGVPAERITAVARGESGTVCADRSAGCQHRNRRVHFLARESGPLQLSASPSP